MPNNNTWTIYGAVEQWCSFCDSFSHLVIVKNLHLAISQAMGRPLLDFTDNIEKAVVEYFTVVPSK